MWLWSSAYETSDTETIIERVFYYVVPLAAGGPVLRPPDFPTEILMDCSQHPGGLWRLTRMQMPLPALASTLARSLVMVALAALLILVLLPAAVAAQAAVAV